MGFWKGKSSVILGIISDLSCLCRVSHLHRKGKNRGEWAKRGDRVHNLRIPWYHYQGELANLNTAPNGRVLSDGGFSGMGLLWSQTRAKIA